MPVNIHGKEYKTVNERVGEFHQLVKDEADHFGVVTELVELTPDHVVMRAKLVRYYTLSGGDLQPITVATGYAQEERSASRIHKTSYVEVCETSAIGRALAAFGLGGEEYASANEMQNALSQQEEDRDAAIKVLKEEILDAVETGSWDMVSRVTRADHEDMKEAWKRLGSKLRSSFKEMEKELATYRDEVNNRAAIQDKHGVQELLEEISSVDNHRALYKIVSEEAREIMSDLLGGAK